MVVIVSLIDGPTTHRGAKRDLALPLRRPPTDDEFLQAVRSGDERLVTYWLGVASDMALWWACHYVCHHDDGELLGMAACLYPEVGVRVVGYPKWIDGYRILHPLHECVSKFGEEAARRGYTAIVRLIAQIPQHDLNWLLHGAVKGGHGALLLELLPRSPGHGSWMLQWAVRYGHEHLYLDLTRFVLTHEDSDVVVLRISCLCDTVKASYLSWLSQPAIAEILNQEFGL